MSEFLFVAACNAFVSDPHQMRAKSIAPSTIACFTQTVLTMSGHFKNSRSRVRGKVTGLDLFVYYIFVAMIVERTGDVVHARSPHSSYDLLALVSHMFN